MTENYYNLSLASQFTASDLENSFLSILLSEEEENISHFLGGNNSTNLVLPQSYLWPLMGNGLSGCWVEYHMVSES